MAERWATFDCYGTLVDWLGGMRAELERLFGVEHADELLTRYHELEPEIQASSPGLSYREVLTIGLERLADERGLGVPEGEFSALARSLPHWPVFPEVPAALEGARRRGWRLGILWINRLGEHDDGRPSRTLPDLTRLPETLDSLVPV